MKKNKKTLMIIVLLVLIVLTTAWAFSKYTTTVTGNATASVAAWSFKANGETATMANVALTDTTITEGTLVEGKIAPGTSGSFDVAIDASGSEVGVDYVIEIAGLDNAPTNLKFTAAGLDASEIVDGKITFSGSIAVDDVDTPITNTINWEWAYETDDIATNDPIDTADSALGDLTYTITVVGTQQNPTV